MVGIGVNAIDSKCRQVGFLYGALKSKYCDIQCPNAVIREIRLLALTSISSSTQNGFPTLSGIGTQGAGMPQRYGSPRRYALGGMPVQRLNACEKVDKSL